MKQFQEVQVISRREAEDMLASGNTKKTCHALLAISFHKGDEDWVQDTCLRLLKNEEPEISGLAATCLGHIARIHKLRDKDHAINALRNQLGNPDIRGRVEDALDDIETFG